MKSPKEIYERFLLQEGRLRTLHQRTQEWAWGRQDVMCEFCSQPVSAVHARCGLCAVAWDQAYSFQRLWVVTRYHFHLPWKSNPYRCTYQRVQDKNQSRVCQRSPHKSHNEDGTPKSIVKRLTYIYGCPCKLWGLIFHAFFWTDHVISRICIVFFFWGGLTEYCGDLHTKVCVTWCWVWNLSVFYARLWIM